MFQFTRWNVAPWRVGLADVETLFWWRCHMVGCWCFLTRKYLDRWSCSLYYCSSLSFIKLFFKPMDWHLITLLLRMPFTIGQVLNFRTLTTDTWIFKILKMWYVARRSYLSNRTSYWTRTLRTYSVTRTRESIVSHNTNELWRKRVIKLMLILKKINFIRSTPFMSDLLQVKSFMLILVLWRDIQNRSNSIEISVGTIHNFTTIFSRINTTVG